MRFHLCASKLDVNNSGFGVGPAMYMQGPIAEIALYESMALPHKNYGPYTDDYSPDCVWALLIKCGLCSLTGPDPGKREWKLVGVYPVSCDGYAQLDLKELAGKGQTADTVLYVAPGECRAA